jgi:hypothetical protein
MSERNETASSIVTLPTYVKLNAPDEKYFLDRAVPVALALQAGVRSVTGTEAATLLRRSFPLPIGGIIFRYPNVAPDYCRFRPESPIENRRYFAPAGREVPIFFIPGPEMESQLPIIIVESPTKSLALTALGFPSIGLGGTGTTLIKGEMSLNSSWATIQLMGRSTIILFDTNRSSNPCVARDEARLAIALENAGARVTVAKLPRDFKGNDWGPDDWIAANGGESIRKIIEASQPANPLKYIESFASQAGAISLLADIPFLLSVENRDAAVKKSVEVAFRGLGITAQDFKGAYHAATKLLKEKQRKTRKNSRRETNQGQRSTKTEVIVNRQPSDVIDETWKIILKENTPPNFFRFGSTIARLQGERGQKKVRVMTEKAISSVLYRIATWLRESENGSVDVPPPSYIAPDMACSPHEDLPLIRSVVHVPFLGRSHKIHTIAGYHPNEQIWLDLPATANLEGFHLRPTIADIELAKELIFNDVLVDFPFSDNASRANCLAAILLPFVRPYIAGPTPLHLIEATKPGSGKNLLMDIISVIATGFRPSIFTEGGDDNEWRKRITANLIRLPFFILIDNIRKKLDSSNLSAALTATVWTDRIMGLSEIAEVPIDTLWYATGNNVETSDEVARRIVPIRLSPMEERPHERQDFKRHDLMEWVKENRWPLVVAALNLIQSWVIAGSPKGLRTLGSFEPWAHTMSGICEHIGVRGFMDNAKTFYDLNDRDSSEWSAFVLEWHVTFGCEPTEGSKLFDLADKEELLLEVRGDRGLESGRIKLGQALARRRDQIMSGFQIQVAGKSPKGRQLYRLAPVNKTAGMPTPRLVPGEYSGRSNTLKDDHNPKPSRGAGVPSTQKDFKK